MVAAPLLATVLLRGDKLAVPDDIELPEEGKRQDPWYINLALALSKLRESTFST